jgi:hypothetical protein
MFQELEKIKEIFLTEEDPEELEYNKQKIIDWEKGIIASEAFLSWKDHDTTQQIMKLARDSYKDISLALALNRNLTQEQRVSYWAKQDACLFLLSFIQKDAKAELDQIHNEIRIAINTV